MTKALIVLYMVVTAAAATAVAQEAKVTPLMTQELAGIAGKEGKMVMVEYAPGGSDAEHRHNAYTFVYVLEGAVVMSDAADGPVLIEEHVPQPQHGRGALLVRVYVAAFLGRPQTRRQADHHRRGERDDHR